MSYPFNKPKTAIMPQKKTINIEDNSIEILLSQNY